jgi:hypothetical protein
MTLGMVCALVGGLTAVAAAQEMPAPPRPGPEHDVFKDFACTWDA